MKIERMVVSPFATNCYILTQDEQAIVIDPGSSAKKIMEHLANYQMMAILLTHGHLDHIGAVDKLYEKYHCPVYVCQDDEKLIRDVSHNTLSGFSATIKSPVVWLQSDHLKVGKFEIDVLYTPGHTNGSVMYIIDHKLFSGDTLFRLSVGRTDLYSGSGYKLSQSLQQLYTLDRDMEVYPGHDEMTTVGFEIDNNPYL